MKKKRLVVLDPRHGGMDSGLRTADGLLEKEVNLIVCQEIKQRLGDVGVEVMLTRDGDYEVESMSRAALANGRGADLFVSWACDMLDDDKVRGVSLWLHDSFREVKGVRGISEQVTKLIRFERVGERLAGMSGQVMLGVFQEPDDVLSLVDAPAVKIKGAFLSNETERKLCQKDVFLHAQARGAAFGILEMLHEQERLQRAAQ